MRDYFKIRITTIAKALIFLFMLYVMWFNDAIGENRLILYGTAIATVFVVLFDIMRTSRSLQNGWYSIIPLLAIYIVSSLLSGVVIASNRIHVIASIITLFAFFMVCYSACYVSKVDNDMEWLLNSFLCIAYVCAVYTIFWGQSVKSTNTYVITMGAGNNPNSLGLVMLLGLFALLNRKRYQEKYLFTLISSALFMYIIILCGSRKCLFSGAVMIVAWAIIDLVKNKANGKPVVKAFRILVMLVAAIGVGYYMINSFISTVAFERVLDLNTGRSMEGRMELYEVAWRLFKTDPFFGVGYREYELVSGTGVYSHSTYAEILACTGILGVLVWSVGLAKEIRQLLRSIRLLKINNRDNYRLIMCLLMFGIELFIGAGQIWYYDVPHLLVLTFIFGLMEMPEYSQVEECTYYE